MKWIRRVFFPYANGEVNRVLDNKLKVVHYTSADVAKSIIQTKQVWMRNATTMNDFSEVQYGIDCLATAYKKTDLGQRFKSVVDSLWPGISDEFQQVFNSWQFSFRQETYITCVSVHSGGDEDLFGRLSMWRAYGGTTGVALVLNPEVFNSTSQELNAFSSPVLYATQDHFNRNLEELILSIDSEKSTISTSLSKEQFLSTVFEAFRFAVMSTKHPGFKEEQEWRVIHSPKLHPSTRLKKSIEVIRGIPQVIYKIPLENHPESGLIGLELPQLLDKIIIGPSQHPQVLFDAFVQLLTDAGIPSPETRVIVSDIPLRLITS